MRRHVDPGTANVVLARSVRSALGARQRYYSSARVPSLTPIAPPAVLDVVEPLKLPLPLSSDTTVPVADADVPVSFISARGCETSRTNYDIDKWKAVGALPNVGEEGFSQVLEEKLAICNAQFNYLDAGSDTGAKKLKQAALEQVLAVLVKMGHSTSMNNEDMEKIVNMCVNNIVRKLWILDTLTFVGDDLPPVTEPAWEYLNIVYQILRRIQNAFSGLSCFNSELIDKILPILPSPDPNERAALQTIIINYLKSHPKKAEQFLPKLAKLLEDFGKNKPPFVVAPVLSIMQHIFFAARTSSSAFVKYFRKIISLLSNVYIAMFEKPLRAVIEFFTDESCGYAGITVRALIMHWPRTCIEKEAFFVRLLIDVLPKMSKKELVPILSRVFGIFGQCSCSQSTKVAEASFQIWTSLHIEPIIQEYASKVVPLLVMPTMMALKTHWSKPVRENAASAMKLMMKIAPRIVEKVMETGSYNEATGQEDLKKWAWIARTAARNDVGVNLGQKLAEITVLYNSERVAAQAKQQAQARAPAVILRPRPSSMRL